MFARLAYLLSALLVGASALAGVQFSSAEWTDRSGSRVAIGASPDWTPPTVAVDDPGYAQWGSVTIGASASDAISAVDWVEIEYRPELGGAWTTLCRDSSAPYSCSWDTTPLADGDYLLRAVATDTRLNSAISDVVPTQVRNTAGMVIDPVPSPTRGTVTLTGRIINGGRGRSTVTFQYAVANDGQGPWTDLPGCSGPGPEGSCDFNTAPTSGTFDLRVVGTVGGRTYDAVQTGIVIDNAAPSVTVNQAVGQPDPTNAAPVRFTVVFSEDVTGFTEADVVLGGTVGGTPVATVSGAGATYTVSVSGMSGDGLLTASVPAGAALDEAGNGSTASTSTDNSVQYDGSPLTVTIDQAASQADPTSGSTINFTVVFSRSVTGFATGDVSVSGTTGGTKTATVTGSGTTYNVAVTGMSGSGTVTVAVAAGRATDGYGNLNQAATSTDDTVTRDVTAPTVTVARVGNASQTGTTLSFTVTFSENVTGFDSGELTLTGTAQGALVSTVSGSGKSYTVTVTGMTGDGTVVARVLAGVAADPAGNANTASGGTAAGRTITWSNGKAPSVTVSQAADQADPATGSTPIRFVVEFSENVTGLTATDFTISSLLGGTRSLSGSGASYVLTISGMTTAGTVTVTLPAGRATDLSNTGNTASTHTDNSVSWTP